MVCRKLMEFNGRTVVFFLCSSSEQLKKLGKASTFLTGFKQDEMWQKHVVLRKGFEVSEGKRKRHVIPPGVMKRSVRTFSTEICPML